MGIIAFRCDASLSIGAGHVMRCLTLARELTKRGDRCLFISRELPGNLNAEVQAEFQLHVLPPPSSSSPAPLSPPNHAFWAEVDWRQDSTETRAAAEELDWLVVDHYAFDARWELAAKPEGARLMVIDDLADRPHECDVLLDDNLGRHPCDYDGLLPVATERLIGPKFALLRPEFARLRPASLNRRRRFRIGSLLLTLGGIDSRNHIRDVLDALNSISTLPKDLRVVIVMSSRAPYIGDIEARLPALSFQTDLRVAVGNMAELMLECDLAISSSGLTLYELICMGIPVLQLPVSDIQRRIALIACEIAEAQVIENWQSDPVPRIAASLRKWIQELQSRVPRGIRIYDSLDGYGVARVLDHISV